MKDKTEKSLLEKYRELQDIHNKALHELADAAQIIKSYEYLEKRSKAERILFERVLALAARLCESEDFEIFEQDRRNLIRAIQEYRAMTTGNNGKSGVKCPPRLLSASSSPSGTTVQ